MTSNYYKTETTVLAYKFTITFSFSQKKFYAKHFYVRYRAMKCSYLFQPQYATCESYKIFNLNSWESRLMHHIVYPTQPFTKILKSNMFHISWKHNTYNFVASYTTKKRNYSTLATLNFQQRWRLRINGLRDFL